MDSKTQNRPENVPYIVFEAEMARQERHTQSANHL